MRKGNASTLLDRAGCTLAQLHHAGKRAHRYVGAFLVRALQCFARAGGFIAAHTASQRRAIDGKRHALALSLRWL